MASTLVATVLATPPPAAEAKAPGVSHCYRSVCHRVRTIAETERLIGRTMTIETSFYDFPGVDRFNAGTFTSNGERFDAGDPARVASADLPDGTELLVRNPVNGRVSHVRVNDFGPFRGNRRLDVTRRVAEDLDFRHKGVVKLEVTVIAAPRAADLTYRRDRPRQPTSGHLGVIFDHEMPALVARLTGAPLTADAAAVRSQPVTLPPAAQPEAVAMAVPSPARVVNLVPRYVPTDALVARPPVANVSEPSEAPPLVVAALAEVPSSAGAMAVPPSTTAAVAVMPETPPASKPMVVAFADTVDAAPVIDLGEPTFVGGPAQVASALAPVVAVQGLAATVIAAPAIAADVSPLQPGFSRHLLLLIVAAMSATLLVLARRAAPVRPVPVPMQPNLPVPQPARRALRTAIVEVESAPTARMPMPAVASAPAPAPAGALIDAGMVIEGRLVTAGRLSIAGTVIGDIEAGEVIVLPGGRVEGDIIATSCRIGGAYRGRIRAEHVGVGPQGALDGVISTRTIAVDFGGRLEAEVIRRRDSDGAAQAANSPIAAST